MYTATDHTHHQGLWRESTSGHHPCYCNAVHGGLRRQLKAATRRPHCSGAKHPLRNSNRLPISTADSHPYPHPFTN